MLQVFCCFFLLDFNGFFWSPAAAFFLVLCRSIFCGVMIDEMRLTLYACNTLKMFNKTYSQNRVLYYCGIIEAIILMTSENRMITIVYFLAVMLHNHEEKNYTLLLLVTKRMEFFFEKL